MCFLSKGTSGGTFLRSWLRLSFPSCRKASYLLGKHHGLDANQPKSIIIRSKHVKTSIFIGFLSLTVPFNQSTRFVWVLDIPAASPATSSKLWPWRAWCPRWHPGRDDPWTGLTPGIFCRKLAVQEASGLRFYLWSLWTLVQAWENRWGFWFSRGFRSNLDTYHGKIKKDWTADCLVPWASLEPGCGLWKSATFGGIKRVKLLNLPNKCMLSNWILN